MKTLNLLVFLTPMFLTACTADVFALPGDDAGEPLPDAATTPDAADAAPLPDATPDVVTSKDAGPDALTVDGSADAGVDAAKDAGPEPTCAPLGYKQCLNNPLTKCAVTAGDGTASCVIPGSTPNKSACSKDDDCGKDQVCDAQFCANLCQATNPPTPWVNNPLMWSSKACSNTSFCAQGYLQVSRLPAWLGICF